MRLTGKIIGGLIGLFLFGVPGAIIGVILGHIVDKNFLASMQGFSPRMGAHSLIQKVFFRSTFTIMGYLAKVDGRVSEREIQAARRVMEQMGLDQNMQQEAIRYFNLGKQPDFNLQKAVSELRQVCLFQPMLLQTFLEIQIFICVAEGEVTPIKRDILQSICQQLGIRGFDFFQYEQQQRAGQNYQRHRHGPQSNPQAILKDAYEILGVPSTTSDEEIKKAYRRLMSKNHPDKLMAKGVPPEMVKIATEKTQQIMNAYETIKQARGIA